MTQAHPRLVFADLDGTLLDHDQRPPASAVDACRALVDKGHRLFMCTGRSMPEIYPWLWDLGFSGAITGAGGYILLNGEVVHDRRIGRADVEAMTRVWERFDGMWMWQGPEAMHPRPGFMESFVTGAGQGGGAWLEYAEVLAPSLREGLPESTTKCTVYFPAGRTSVEQLRSLIPSGMQLISGSIQSGPTMVVESYPRDVSKGRGIEILADRLGIPIERTVAVGDSDNDIEALSTAGLGIAMGGAGEEVVAAADRVAPPLAEDGFARAMEMAGLI